MSEFSAPISHNSYKYNAFTTDGELLDQLKYYRCILEKQTERLSICSSQEALKTLDSVKHQLLLVVLQLESIGYNCDNTRSLI